MKPTTTFITTLLYIWSTATVVHSKADPTCSPDGSNNDQTCKASSSSQSSLPVPTYRDTCEYYLAESSIPNAGFGIYTVKDIPASTTLTEVADAPSIIVTDILLHNEHKKDYVLWNHENYFWDGYESGEYESHTVEDSVMTFGSLCNYHTYLKNVKPFETKYNDAITPRSSKSPGMGAYSYQMGYLFQSTVDIERGEEVFCDYGSEWLEGREKLGHVAREEDYKQAAAIVIKVAKGHELNENDKNWEGNKYQQLEDSDNPFPSDRTIKTIKDVVEHLNQRVSNVLPDNQKSLESLLSKSRITPRFKNTKSYFHSDKIQKELAKNTVTPRSMEWIQTTGKCLDNLVPQLSTLPHAGRGAFAQRFIPKGESIVPLPLLQIMDYTSMFMYDFEVDDHGVPFRPAKVKDYYDDEEEDESEDEDGFEEDEEIPMGTQLMVNYCLSHPKTSMFLCPQTNGILMNHCSDRTNMMTHGGDCAKYNSHEDPTQRGANAKLVWDAEFDPDTEEWLNLTTEEISSRVENGKRGLSLDAIATRDIYPGEEVFIDYGVEWEEEWKEHLETFVPPEIENYVPVREMNDNKGKYVRTTLELEERPYPANAKLTCFYWLDDYEKMEDDLVMDDDDLDWEDGDGSIFTLDSEDYEYGSAWPCQVLERNDDDADGPRSYTVEILNSEIERTLWGEMGTRRTLLKYPEESFVFLQKKYASDQHIIGAFRSYIRIPDEIFPVNWVTFEDDE